MDTYYLNSLLSELFCSKQKSNALLLAGE